MSDGSNRVALFGREREMAELNAALDDALQGRARFVAISGEAGIGKTRLVEEIADGARELGARVLSASCYMHEGAPPYRPWAQAFAAPGMAPSAAETGVDASFVSGALPWLDDAEIREFDSDVATFRLFESVTAFMASLAERQPLVLVLEDVHWADDATVRLLEFAGLNLSDQKILIVATFRDAGIDSGSYLPLALGNLARTRGFSRIRLEGLSVGGVEEILRDRTGSSPPRRTLDEVMNRTEGNPFFVTEIARELGRSTHDSPESGSDSEAFWRAFQIPEEITAAVSLRMAHLSPETKKLLSVAAVVGRGFEFRELALAAPDVSENDMIAALEESLSEGVLAPITDLAEGYRFTHVLFQQTLINELSPRRRVRLHASFAEALEEDYGQAAGRHAEILSRHFRAAEPVLGPERALSYSLAAGERAISAHAYGDALPHFAYVLERAREGGVEDDRLAEANMGAGIANAALRNIREGLTHLSAAFEHYIAVEDRAKIAEIGRCQLVGNEGMAGMIPIMERALSHLEPDGIDAARVMALYGRAVGTLEDDYQTASDSLNKALAIARRERDRSLEFRCHALAANMSAFHMRYELMESHVQQALQLAGGVDAPLEQAQVHLLAAALRAVDGQHVDAREHLQLALAAAESAGNSERISSVSTMGLWIACNIGDWDEARAWAERSRAAWEDDPRTLGLMAVVNFETGDTAAAEALLERVAELRSDPQIHTLAEHISWVVQPHAARISGSGEYAASAAKSARESLATGVAAPSNRFDAERAVSWAIAISGDGDSAAEACSRISDFSSTPWGYIGVTSVSELLGNLAQAAGDAGVAAGHYEEALRVSEQAGFRRCHAWICHDYAAMLLGSISRADQGRAADLIAEAVPVAAELGMTPLLAKLEALSAGVGATGGAGHPDGLSNREVQVLGLIAHGVPNKAVAEQLFISPHTVVRHVANIYTKIGVNNRAEAAVYAERHGLTGGANSD